MKGYTASLYLSEIFRSEGNVTQSFEKISTIIHASYVCSGAIMTVVPIVRQ